ncbi:MAG: BON domain-containing protein [Desulfosarcina sp.]|nr:BON domain-containing protein [Desulfosarcina sp.]
MNLSRTGFFIVVLLSFFLGLSGCEQKGTAEKAGEKIDQAAEKVGEKIAGAQGAISDKAEKTGIYMNDAAITAKIKADILSDPLLKVSQINVTTTNGVVKLSGTVDSQQSIDRAMEITQSVEDVKSVENSLAVKGS